MTIRSEKNIDEKNITQSHTDYSCHLLLILLCFGWHYLWLKNHFDLTDVEKTIEYLFTDIQEQNANYTTNTLSDVTLDQEYIYRHQLQLLEFPSRYIVSIIFTECYETIFSFLVTPEY